MKLKTFRGGIHPDGHKELSKGQPVEAYLPKGDLVFPVNQHIGKPARPVVAKGDSVFAGQIIAEADGYVSANIISSCSGKVKAIEERRTASGAGALCIVIENDGQYTLAPGIGKKSAEGDALKQGYPRRDQSSRNCGAWRRRLSDTRKADLRKSECDRLCDRKWF